MSQQLIDRSLDLRRLRDEGYDIEVRSGHLLVRDVPYVTTIAEIKRGILVTTLTLAGEVTTRPSTHVAYFAGEHPCNKDGSELAKIKHQSVRQELIPGVMVDHSFSSKPSAGYIDYHELVTTYITIISSPAAALDSTVTAKTFPAIAADPEESVFQYTDTASSRAGISALSRKLAVGKVAIVGLGGTGSYVLDLVAKTPVREIHLFDGDTFSQHNAFRSPGAPSIEELQGKPTKVDFLHQRYSRMHRYIVPHAYYIDESNIDNLRGMDVVFLCLDGGSARKLLVERLEAFDIPFIDVGMGLTEVDGALIGVLRITTSTKEQREHVREKNRIPFSDGDDNDAYVRNIQVADLNALNATLAVIKWKKLCGFYVDLDQEHHSTYTIDGNTLTNEDKMCKSESPSLTSS